MKKLISMFLVMATVLTTAALTALTVSAATVDSGVLGDNITWTLDSGGTLTISGSGDMDDDYLYSYGAPWNDHNSEIKTVIINEGVTSIGLGAFESFTAQFGSAIHFPACTNLTNVIIPNTVVTISHGAFRDCTSLNSITIPSSVTYIGNYVFSGCSSLANIIIPESIDIIGIGAFSETAYCNDSTNFQDGVLYLANWIIDAEATIKSCNVRPETKGIAGEAFLNCNSLTSITLPESVTYIGDHAFRACASLTNITIPNSVTSIGDYAFENCTGLISVTISDVVDRIGSNTFAGCSSLTRVTIPDSVTHIERGAFENCSNLTSITLPEGVTNIGDYVFSGCSSLTNIIIPESIDIIGREAFSGTAYYNDSTNWQDDVLYLANWIIDAKTTIKSCNIKSETKGIAEEAFSDCSNLTNIKIPDSVIYIGWWAFENCSSLASITLPDSVTYIGGHAFEGCSRLVNITIPEKVTSIEIDTFNNCTSLASITIPDSVTYIGWWAFNYCQSLTDVYYIGTESQWNKITIEQNNAPLLSANIHFANDDADVKIGGAVEDKTARKISADFQNASGAAKTFDAICAVYDERGALITYEDVTVTVASGETRKIEFFLSVGGWDSYKLFAWDGLGSMRPLGWAEV